MPPPKHFTKFTNLCGVPVHWGKWGRTGSRYLDPAFLTPLERALSTLFDTRQFGNPTAILSGGAYVPPPHPPRHSLGTAFDLSGFELADGTRWELHREWRRSPRVALATEAALRGSLPQVLGPWYNKAHRDHWHVDDRPVAGFSGRFRSDVTFLQACLNHFWDAGLKIDGKYGSLTRSAAADALASINQPPAPGSPTVWGAFLEAVWRCGFGVVEGWTG